MTFRDVCSSFLKVCAPNVVTSSNESSPSKVEEVALPLLRASSDSAEQEEPNTPDFGNIYKGNKISNVDEIPKQNNVSRVMGSPLILNNNPGATNEPPRHPPTPRASTRSIAQSKFFEEAPAAVKEVIPEPPKDQTIKPVQVQKTPLTIWDRRELEGIKETEPIAMNQFEEWMTQGRMARCIKLFESGANRNAIKLMKTFTDEVKIKLLEQLRVEGKGDFAVEVEFIMLKETLSGPGVQEWALDRCTKFFEEGKEKEAMLWAVTLTQVQKEKIVDYFIKANRFEFVVKIRNLMDQGDVKSIFAF